MKQVVQNFRSGQLKVEELPPPALRPGGVLVRASFSLISAGTERTTIETGQSSLIGKARSRPDVVGQVVGTFKGKARSSPDLVRQVVDTFKRRARIDIRKGQGPIVSN